MSTEIETQALLQIVKETDDIDSLRMALIALLASDEGVEALRYAGMGF